jgi:hypothetical protein
VNPKCKPKFVLHDACINYWFTSNDLDCFYTDPEDRRFFIVTVEGGPLGQPFFDEFFEWRDQKNGLSALRSWLASVRMQAPR